MCTAQGLIYLHVTNPYCSTIISLPTRVKISLFAPYLTSVYNHLPHYNLVPEHHFAMRERRKRGLGTLQPCK